MVPKSPIVSSSFSLNHPSVQAGTHPTRIRVTSDLGILLAEGWKRLASGLARRTDLDVSREIWLLLQGTADLFGRLVAACPNPDEHNDEKYQRGGQPFPVHSASLARHCPATL